MLCLSRRVVKQPNQFMYLGKSFEAILKEHEIDPIDCNKAMSNKGLLPFRHGIPFSQDRCPKTREEKERMQSVPYASVVGALMYAMLCTRPDIFFEVGMVSRYQFNPSSEHWITIKHILKYFRRTRDYVLVLQNVEIV
ncbi:hypothetical protein AAG906_010506 [Vitis piasezkii]